MPADVRVRGTGTIELAAYGIADAEAQAEKELGRALPNARLSITSVRRAADGPRIVEEFVLDYAFTVDLPVEAENDESARREATASVRRELTGTRFARTALVITR